MIDCFLGDAFGALFARLGVLFCSVVLGADTHFKILDSVVSGASFLTGVCLSVTLLIVDMWQYYECRARSGVTRCTLFIVLYLSRSGLHAVL